MTESIEMVSSNGVWSTILKFPSPASCVQVAQSPKPIAKYTSYEWNFAVADVGWRRCSKNVLVDSLIVCMYTPVQK